MYLSVTQEALLVGSLAPWSPASLHGVPPGVFWKHHTEEIHTHSVPRWRPRAWESQLCLGLALTLGMLADSLIRSSIRTSEEAKICVAQR